MRYPPEWYQMSEMIAERFPSLRPAQQRGLALWVYGTILARSACQNAVIVALFALGTWHGLRQHLREWLYDGQDRAAPCRTEVEVSLCFGPLIRWVLDLWVGRDLPLAIDVTAHQDRVVSLTVAILYRGLSLPIAWAILPANQEGAWMGEILRLLRLIRREVPKGYRVIVMADRGLWSGRLWKRIRDLGWHPLLRLRGHYTFTPTGQGRQQARTLVQGPGHAWVGQGLAFGPSKPRRKGTLVVVWAEGEQEPWVLLTDLRPNAVGLGWYGLRTWIELGFRALKGIGWRWEHTRRVDPERVSRHWLVLAVATLLALGTGTRAEDAERLGLAPGRLRKAPEQVKLAPKRQASVFVRGLSWLNRQLGKGHLWQRLWLTPEPWPEPPPNLQITYHATA